MGNVKVFQGKYRSWVLIGRGRGERTCGSGSHGDGGRGFYLCLKFGIITSLY